MIRRPWWKFWEPLPGPILMFVIEHDGTTSIQARADVPAERVAAALDDAAAYVRTNPTGDRLGAS